MVNSISSGMSTSRMNFATSDSLGNIEKMFISLSVSMGGDGKGISKSQLSEYIKKVERGQIKLSKKKLDTLKNIHKNWDKLFDKKESIGVDDFEKNISAFAPLFVDSSIENIEVVGEKIEQAKEKNKKEAEKVEEFEELKEKVKADEKGITKDNLKDYMKTLFEEHQEKDETSEEQDAEKLNEIDYITNLIAEFDEITGGSEYMTSLEKSTDFKI